MSNISKELLKDYVMEQNFTNPNEVLTAMKEMFREAIQRKLSNPN